MLGLYRDRTGGIAVWCSANSKRWVDRDAAWKTCRDWRVCQPENWGGRGIRDRKNFRYIFLWADERSEEVRTSANQTADYTVGPGPAGGT